MTDSTKTDLKPCPFCGSTAIEDDYHSVECRGCDAIGPPRRLHDFTSAEAWDARTDEPSPKPKGPRECGTCIHLHFGCCVAALPSMRPGEGGGTARWPKVHESDRCAKHEPREDAS